MDNKNTGENKETKKKIDINFDKKLDKFFSNIYERIGITGTVLISILVLIGFMWLVSKEPFLFSFDIASSSNVGDALAGITAPFIGLIAVILTYKAFKVQYDFNEKQLDFNTKQLDFYQKDKIDKLTEEYNNLIISIIKNDSTLFTNNYSIPTPIFTKCFQNIYDEYIDNSIEHKLIARLISENFLISYTEDEREDAESIKDLPKKIDQFILGSIFELNTFRNLLYSFLHEVDKYKLNENQKIEIINSFMIKYSILNKNSNIVLTYLILTHFEFIDVGIKTDATREQKRVVRNVLKRMVIKEPEESIECLDYIAKTLI